jgi:hypothetical protein
MLKDCLTPKIKILCALINANPTKKKGSLCWGQPSELQQDQCYASIENFSG